MRFLFAILAVVALASCVTPSDNRFFVGQSDRAFVIIGLAESAENTSARYSLLWRLLDGEGFADFDARYFIQPESNTRDSIRVRGVPGEFLVFEVRPGTYALDGVFALIRDQRVNYVADGLIEGPARPAFDVRAGEAIYLGIWQTNIEDSSAVTRLWRLDDADLRAVLSSGEELVVGPVHLRETYDRAVACT
ncbi:MAG: hypothetical protein K2X34_08925, partial [Hyphomonadaceae bacterium]|nr:hypothetical protein [Hyphomonadaceae bacterium]